MSKFVPDFKAAKGKPATTGKPAAKTAAKSVPAKKAAPTPARGFAALKTKALATPVPVTPPPGKVIALKPIAKPVTAWSFSRYQDYMTCPLKFRLKHIEKVHEPKNDAMQRGIDAHDDAEKWTKGTIPKLPLSLAAMKDEFARMRKLYKGKKLPMIVEDNWAFTKDWDETQWNNWAECWVRIKLDCAHYEEEDGRMIMIITDWKTGKANSYKVAEYMEQLDLYALAGMLMSSFDEVTVRPRLGWLDDGTFYPNPDKGEEVVEYTRADLPRLVKEWAKRVKPMMSALNFPPKANSKCQWCFYGQAGRAKGGPGLCKF